MILDTETETNSSRYRCTEFHKTQDYCLFSCRNSIYLLSSLSTSLVLFIYCFDVGSMSRKNQLVLINCSASHGLHYSDQPHLCYLQHRVFKVQWWSNESGHGSQTRFSNKRLYSECATRSQDSNLRPVSPAQPSY